MIEKIYNYKDTKYKILTIFDKINIVLESIAFIFILFILFMFLKEKSFDDITMLLVSLLAILMFTQVVPIAFFLVSNRNKLVRSLDTWVKTSNNELYFIESYEYTLKDQVNDINYLNNLIKATDYEDNLYCYKIQNIDNIIDYKTYVKVIFNGMGYADKTPVKKEVYIMKAIPNFNELMDNLKLFSKGE